MPPGLLVARGVDGVVVEQQAGRTVEEPGLALVWQLDAARPAWAGLTRPQLPAIMKFAGRHSDAGAACRHRNFMIAGQSGAWGRVAGMPISAADLLSAAYNDADRTIDLRRRLHRHPEIGLQLPQTQATVLDAFAELPVEVTTGKSVSSVVGVLRGARPGPTYLLRADMDALQVHEDTGLPFASEIPGAMHACGHDTHVAMLLGAARLLAERRDLLAGQVVFMLQPGEEGLHGARYMLEEGLLDVVPEAPVSGAFAMHIISNLPSGSVNVRPGPMMAAADQWRMTVRGRGGHASMPHSAADPVPVAAEIVLALQSMVTRRVDVFDPAVVTVAHIAAGSRDNVIPEIAFLEGTIRTLSAERRRDVVAAVERVATHVAAAHDMTLRGRAHGGLSGDRQRPRRGRAGAGDGARRCWGSRPPPSCRRRSWAPRTSPTCCSGCPARWRSSAPARPGWSRRPRRPTTATWWSSTRSRCRPASRSTRRWPCRPSPAEPCQTRATTSAAQPQDRVTPAPPCP